MKVLNSRVHVSDGQREFAFGFKAARAGAVCLMDRVLRKPGGSVVKDEAARRDVSYSDWLAFYTPLSVSVN